ncbi:transposase family protein [Streptomyces sp. NPDC003247]|uniref:transposase family protein n=1 Tax=Streptomyces sp. NPDC003247 TaxID=3364677 RepID=UPI0036B11A5B
MVCPGCGQESTWEHSRYVRHVADEAIGGRPVVIDVSVRRLSCENADDLPCPRGRPSPPARLHPRLGT